MRYGAGHVQHDQQGVSRRGAHAHVTQRSKKIAYPREVHIKIERPGGNPTARDDLYLTRCQHTAQRTLAHEGLRA